MHRVPAIAIGSLSLALLVTVILVGAALPSKAPPLRIVIAPGAHDTALYVLFSR